MASLRDEIGDFTAIPNDFITDDRQTPESLCVFVFLRFHTNKRTKTAFPSYETLIGETKLSRQKLAAALALLDKTGWVVKQKRFGASTLYRIRMSDSHSSSTMEQLEAATVVPLWNNSSSTMEQPPLDIKNKIKYNKSERPVQFSIEELEDPLSLGGAKLQNELAAFGLSFSEFYRKWWVSRVNKQGIGRRKNEKLEARHYILNLTEFFAECARNQSKAKPSQPRGQTVLEKIEARQYVQMPMSETSLRAMEMDRQKALARNGSRA